MYVMVSLIQHLTLIKIYVMLGINRIMFVELSVAVKIPVREPKPHHKQEVDSGFYIHSSVSAVQLLEFSEVLCHIAG